MTAVAKVGTQPNSAWAPRDAAALAAVGRGRVAVVDVDITRAEPVAALGVHVAGGCGRGEGGAHHVTRVDELTLKSNVHTGFRFDDFVK